LHYTIGSSYGKVRKNPEVTGEVVCWLVDITSSATHNIVANARESPLVESAAPGGIYYCLWKQGCGVVANEQGVVALSMAEGEEFFNFDCFRRQTAGEGRGAQFGYRKGSVVNRGYLVGKTLRGVEGV
jgi:hypothetical protein